MTKFARQRTCVWIEGAPSIWLQLKAYADELSELGFDIMKDQVWGDRANQTQKVLWPKLLNLIHADVMLFWATGAQPENWIRVGFAAATGLRIICIGPAELPPELKDFFMLTVPTWDDLARNEFLKLGDGFFKKGKL